MIKGGGFVDAADWEFPKSGSSLLLELRGWHGSHC